MPPPNPFHQSSAPTSAHERHTATALARQHLYHAPPVAPPPARTERDILLEHHRFLRADDDASTYEARLAKSYDARLYKEFALIELSRWREGRIAMRWRTEDEVVAGKGETGCARIGCSKKAEGEREVLFEYVEEDEKREALVKVRLCEACLEKLRRARGGKRESDEKRERGGSGKRDRGEKDRTASRDRDEREGAGKRSRHASRHCKRDRPEKIRPRSKDRAERDRDGKIQSTDRAERDRDGKIQSPDRAERDRAGKIQSTDTDERDRDGKIQSPDRAENARGGDVKSPATRTRSRHRRSRSPRERGARRYRGRSPSH